MKIGYDYYDAPIGKIFVVVSENGVCKVELFEEEWNKYIKQKPNLTINKELCKEVITQIDEYFQGERKEFNLKLDINSTRFRENVWKALVNIPYGKTQSYQQIAEAIGNRKAVRAVGQANKANQLPLIIPCHRVIGKDKNLVGFAGNNTPVKKWLLQHEGYYEFK